jgi:cyclopropane fatty-acyl-phospholipid synthase-like methyltransferase
MMTPATNVEQARFWNEEGADAWVDEQEHMDVQLAPFASAVYAAAGTRGGDRVLDVGCGCGVTTLELARTVGQSGSVVGVDISGPMIVRGCRCADSSVAEAALRSCGVAFWRDVFRRSDRGVCEHSAIGSIAWAVDVCVLAHTR